MVTGQVYSSSYSEGVAVTELAAAAAATAVISSGEALYFLKAFRYAEAPFLTVGLDLGTMSTVNALPVLFSEAGAGAAAPRERTAAAATTWVKKTIVDECHQRKNGETEARE